MFVKYYFDSKYLKPLRKIDFAGQLNRPGTA